VAPIEADRLVVARAGFQPKQMEPLGDGGGFDAFDQAVAGTVAARLWKNLSTGC
jgi:hypothetical protein